MQSNVRSVADIVSLKLYWFPSVAAATVLLGQEEPNSLLKWGGVHSGRSQIL